MATASPIVIEEVAFGSDRYEQLCKLRDDILRHPLGMRLNKKDVAQDDIEFHIAALEEGFPVGCVLLRPLTADLIKLRQMAVRDSHQGRDIGKKLVLFAQELALSRGFKTIEAHARVSAQGFYEKLGYATVGDAFIEVTVPTIRMTRAL